MWRTERKNKWKKNTVPLMGVSEKVGNDGIAANIF